MIENYEIYLQALDKLLKRYFESQKDFICCKEGCSRCCEVGEYPITELEYQYVLVCYSKLAENEKLIVASRIENIKDIKSKSENKKYFVHECPFLINKKCSIYNYRPLICRTHGLIFYKEDESGGLQYEGPKCMDYGLNYSQVYDQKQKIISDELLEKSGINTQPLIYNLSQKALLNASLVNELKLSFCETKPLIDFF